MKLLAISCIFFIHFINASFINTCKQFEKELKHEFHPLRHCQRSNKTVIAYSNVKNVEKCAEFTRISRGLAFNFSPRNRSYQNMFEFSKNSTNNTSKIIDSELHEFSNCQVLDCPEYRNFSSIVNDTRFDYYSMYAYPAPIENSTCIPMLGMFMLFKDRKNYSTAHSTCNNFRGELAHIVTERRTNEISKFLRNTLESSSSKDKVAFIGLNETSRGKFFTSNAEPLECFEYRAWHRKHPPEIRKPACIVITEVASWKTLSCNKKSMFICEILTSGPNPNVNNLKRKCSTKQPNNRYGPKKSPHS